MSLLLALVRPPADALQVVAPCMRPSFVLFRTPHSAFRIRHARLRAARDDPAARRGPGRADQPPASRADGVLVGGAQAGPARRVRPGRWPSDCRAGPSTIA